jgi:hypothetical protein
MTILYIFISVPSWPWSFGSWIYNYLCNLCLSSLTLWVRIPLRARCTTLCDKVCQWLTTGWWFSPGTTVSSTKKTDCHDITEILLKVAIKPTNSMESLHLFFFTMISHNNKNLFWSLKEYYMLFSYQTRVYNVTFPA